MIQSQSILPIRFYSDLHDQDRFNYFHRKFCDSLLNYPPNELPQFQITRHQSLAEPIDFILRNVCNDNGNYGKIIPEQASNFGEPGATNHFGTIETGGIFDDGINPPSGVTGVQIGSFDCGKYKSNRIENITTSAPYASIPIQSNTTNIYTIKIIVDKLVQGPSSSFSIKVYNDTILLGTITAPGVYTYNFTSNGNNSKVTFDSFEAGDEFEISYLQCIIEPINATYTTDVELDVNDLNIFTTKDQTDIIIFCDNVSGYNVAPGQYYFMIRFDDRSYMFSEVFNIKSYKEIEKHYRLSWWSDVDLNGQIYYNQDWIGCAYKNFVYLDASLFQPEYETSTENIKNGENEDVPVFKKWQKSTVLQIIKAPEFLADALSGIFLHDYIYLRNPLNQLQEIQSQEYEVIESTSEISPVLDDAYQKVELKLLLSDNYTDTNCEESVDPFTCEGIYAYKAAASSANAPYYLTITGPPTAGDGLYRHSDNTLIEPQPDDIIYDYDNGRYYKMEEITGIWQIVETYPVITSANVSGLNYVVIGKAIPNTFVRVQYNKDSAGWVNSYTGEVDEDGNYSVEIPTALSSGASDFDIRVKNISRECEFATSSVLDII